MTETVHPSTGVLDRINDFIGWRWFDGSWGSYSNTEFSGACLMGAAYRAAQEMLSQQGLGAQAGYTDSTMESDIQDPVLKEAVDAMKEAILHLYPEWLVNNGFADERWRYVRDEKGHPVRDAEGNKIKETFVVWKYVDGTHARDMLNIPTFNDHDDVDRTMIRNVVEEAKIILQKEEWHAEWRKDNALIAQVMKSKEVDKKLVEDVKQLLREADEVLGQARNSVREYESARKQADQLRNEARTRYREAVKV